MKQVLTNLISKLVKQGFIYAAADVSEILSELDDDDEGALDPSSIINIVGLRGDVKPEQPTGGVTVSPFFFDTGDSF